MAKRQTQETYGQVKKDQGNAQGLSTGLADQNAHETQQASGNLGNEEGIRDQYSALTGGTPNVSGVNSKINTSRFSDLYDRYKGLADTGGYSPESRGNIMSDIGGLREMGRTGGIDDASANRFRGNGVYDEFSKTGGLSDADRGNIRSRALSSVSANASGTNDELARRRAVQGGFAPGFDSASRALQRDTARNISGTALDANLGIADRVRQGRQWGAEGASNSEANLQGLRTGNQYRGLMGASNQEMGMNNSIFGNSMSALGGARGTAGDIAGVEGENIGNEFRNRGIDEGNINRSLDSKYRGIAGQHDMYNTDLGRYTGALDRGGQIYGQGQQVNQGYYGARNPLATQPGIGGNIMRGIGSAAGVGAALYGGGKGFGLPIRRPNMGTGSASGQFES